MRLLRSVLALCLVACSAPAEAGFSGAGVLAASHNAKVPYSSMANGSSRTFQSSTPSAFQVALGWWVPAGATRWRARIVNRDSFTGTGTDPMSGVEIALGTSNGSATDFNSAPTVISGVTIPGSGAFYNSPWVPVSRGSDGKVFFSYSTPSGAKLYYDSYPVGVWNYAASGVSAYPLVGTAAAGDNILTVIIDTDYTGSRYTVIGDSLSIGVGTTNLDNSAFRLLQTSNGIPTAVVGVSGISLQALADPAQPWLWDYVNVSGSKIIIEAGINDLGTRTAGQMEADLSTIITKLTGLGATRIVCTTITPSSVYHAGDSTRVTYNTYLQTLPLGIAAVADVAATLQNPADHSYLDPSYDSGDGIHWNNAANAAAKTTIAAQLSVVPWQWGDPTGLAPIIPIYVGMLIRRRKRRGNGAANDNCKEKAA